MSLLKLLIGGLKATVAFYIVIIIFEALGILALPNRIYSAFGFLTGYIFFIIAVCQLPENNKNRNKADLESAKTESKSGQKHGEAVG